MPQKHISLLHLLAATRKTLEPLLRRRKYKRADAAAVDGRVEVPRYRLFE
jgi:hypothetical protein